MDGSEHWRLEGVLERDARDRATLLLPDTDATAILYFTKDGPFRFRLDSGEVLWRVDDWDEDPPYNLGRSGGSSATMVLEMAIYSLCRTGRKLTLYVSRMAVACGGSSGISESS